jgi:uncharacterized protein (TIRG00374 family)
LKCGFINMFLLRQLLTKSAYHTGTSKTNGKESFDLMLKKPIPQPTPPTPAPNSALASDQVQPKKRANVKQWLFRLTVMALLLVFLWQFKLDPNQLVNNLLHANLWLVLASIVLIVPIMAIKSWRWCLILKSLGQPLNFRLAFRLYGLGLAAGSFTPGQAGDVIKAWYLRDRGFKLSTALISVIIDRLADVVVLSLWASLGLLILGAAFISELPVLLVVLVLVSLGLVGLSLPIVREQLLAKITKFISRKVARKELKLNAEVSTATTTADSSRIESEVTTFQHTNWNFLLLTFVATLLTSSLAVLRVWLVAIAIGMPLNFLEAVAASSLATVVGLVPISIAGIGTRDLALIGILSKLGYSRESAVVLSSFILLHNLVNLVFGYLVWLTRPSSQGPAHKLN